jgi:hypothetical protein
MSAEIVYDMSREDYDALDRVNFSSLKHILRSPAHYKAALGVKPEPTDAMTLGTVVHGLILEPDKTRFAVWDGGRRAGKEWDAFSEAHRNAGVTILKAEDAARAKAMAAAVRSKPYVMGLLDDDGREEVTIKWENQGVLLKGRADWVCGPSGHGAILDLKTTRDASVDGFGREFAQRNCAMQLSMYFDGLRDGSATFDSPILVVAIENEAPFDVVVYRVPMAVLNYGFSLYGLALDRLLACRRLGEWPGTDNGLHMIELSLPSWAVAS